MIIWIGIAIGAVIVGWVLLNAFSGTSIKAATDLARETGKLELLIEAIEDRPEAEQATHWDHAIDSLWNSYAREEAARLTMAAAERSQSDAIQYWMRQVLEVEPEVASRVFTQEFLDQYFDPEIAAKCGKGCCG